MNMTDYYVEVHFRGSDRFIVIKSTEENGEMALNKVQGMIHSINGWISLTDVTGSKFRVKENDIVLLSLACDRMDA